MIATVYSADGLAAYVRQIAATILARRYDRLGPETAQYHAAALEEAADYLDRLPDDTVFRPADVPAARLPRFDRVSRNSNPGAMNCRDCGKPANPTYVRVGRGMCNSCYAIRSLRIREALDALWHADIARYPGRDETHWLASIGWDDSMPHPNDAHFRS